jgi:hypothetical protein
VTVGLFSGCEAWTTPAPQPEPPLSEQVFAVPDDLEFQTSVLQSGQGDDLFQVVNDTSQVLTVWNYTDVDDSEGALAFEVGVGLPLTIELDPGGVLDVPVTFRPTADATYQGHVVVNTSRGDLIVTLAGQGLAPRLDGWLEDIPEAPVGCAVEATLVLTNVGREALGVTEVSSSGMGQFTLLDLVPATIAPGVEVRLPVAFSPGAEGVAAGVLRLATNDPEQASFSVDLEGMGIENPTIEEHFHFRTGDGISVLLVAEDEGHSAWPGVYAGALSSLLDAFERRGIDYQVASASTDDACPTATGRFVDASMPRDEAVGLLASALFDGHVGTYGTRLLELTRLAVVNTTPGGCLAGFLRSGDPLHVLIAADRPDESAAGWQVEVQRIQTALNEQVTFSAITPIGVCDAPVTGYPEAASLTGGLSLDLCATLWESHWSALAGLTAAMEGGPTAFQLSRTPLADTVLVEVDGVPWSDFVLDGQEVDISGEPPAGAVVAVRYAPADVCP